MKKNGYLKVTKLKTRLNRIFSFEYPKLKK